MKEIHEAKGGQRRSIAFLDRDSLGDKVKLSKIILPIRLLMKIVDNTDQTRLKLLDTVRSADLTHQTTNLLVEVLILIADTNSS